MGMYKVEEQSSLPLNYSAYGSLRFKSMLVFRFYERTIRETVISWDKRSTVELPED